MATVTSTDKKKFSQKLLECQKKGLLQYGKYLNDQLKASANKELKKQYHSYIEDQIALNDKRIAAIDVKLK
ncbi:MAG: hypothetical protein AB7O47_00360 [Flavobacteriales bacterium]